jgi:hypothetical protein
MGVLVWVEVGVGKVVDVCVAVARGGAVIGSVATGVEDAAGLGVGLGKTTVTRDAAAVAVAVVTGAVG